MKIKSVHIRRYRSVESTSLVDCGDLNILIGKNNSGKSNILTAIEKILEHLNRGSIAGPWFFRRPVEDTIGRIDNTNRNIERKALDDFYNRDTKNLTQIGIEFELSPETNKQLRNQLLSEAPHRERLIEQIQPFSTMAFVVAIEHSTKPFLFIEQIAAGNIVSSNTNLVVEGIQLLSVPRSVANELFAIYQEGNDLRSDIRALESILASRARLDAVYAREGRVESYYIDNIAPGIRPVLNRQIRSLTTTSGNIENLIAGLNSLIAETREKSEVLAQKQTEGVIAAFSGDTRSTPDYVRWLAKKYGSIPFLHLTENRRRIGREEAEALLRLKVKRGGSEILQTVQNTVRTLLGVTVDAFEPEDITQDRLERRTSEDRRIAEMDIDNFLVDANGAGIREALRIVLDLELQQPNLVLIEEPEVHLHPGLEHTIHSYLKEKSSNIQLFVTTHSTNFIDTVAFQNIYLVSRDEQNRTVSELLNSGDGTIKIPSELGLRLSTVFMFDKLVFVEGPTDEEVFREFARKAGFDIARSNVGFVRMQGVRNFAHFAAEETLILLSKRQVKMWFIMDRDEKEDEEVKRMTERLGTKAKLVVLKKRELENYLLDAEAVLMFIADKKAALGRSEETLSIEDIKTSLSEEANNLKDEAIRLRLEKKLLKSIHLQNRTVSGTIGDRINQAITELTQRAHQVALEVEAINTELETVWSNRALEIAPGSLILERVAQKYGVKYSKVAGDSARIAAKIRSTDISSEIVSILREFCH